MVLSQNLFAQFKLEMETKGVLYILFTNLVAKELGSTFYFSENIFYQLINAKCPIYRTFDQNFNFNFRRDPQKNFRERFDYESIDEKS